MPNIESGHYFLTALIPIRILEEVAPDASAAIAPANSLRQLLALMPTEESTEIILAGEEALVCGGDTTVSPFARNTLNHFVRFAVIDAIQYNGRLAGNFIVEAARNVDLSIPQPIDCLSRPFLLFSVEFDANQHGAPEPDVYLDCLWDTMESAIRQIFDHCHGFERVRTAGDFVRYIKGCQLETTMPFCDYWISEPQFLKFSKAGAFIASTIAAAGAGGLVYWLLAGDIRDWLVWTLAIVAGLLALATSLIWQIIRHGRRPFPTAHGSNLRNVLKALYLQRQFSEFATASQELSANELHAAFGEFLDTHQPSEPVPTQRPAVVGL
jgi:hypothetical protein